MQKMSPDELRRQMSGAQAQSQAQREYNYKASETLKNEGNKLVGCALSRRGSPALPRP